MENAKQKMKSVRWIEYWIACRAFAKQTNLPFSIFHFPFSILILSLLITTAATAQVTRAERDSANATPVSGITSDTVGKIKGQGLSRHQKAALYSAALPGLGQIYNRQYWKLPIVYGAAATLTYFIVTNNRSYQAYNNELIFRLDNVTKDTPEPRSRFTTLTNLQVIRLRDRYRRDRDFSIIIAGLVYLLQIADAHVFSHLLSFNVSDDLSLKAQPAVHPGGAVVLSLNLSFK